MTHTPDIISFTPLLRSTADDTQAVERLQAATLEILERIGVCFPCAPALEVFRRHGASVDGDGVVRLTPELVERALATAPRSFVLGGREPRFDLTLDGTRTYLSTEGVGTLVRDPETGEERSSRKADVELMARIVDALPAISFFWPPVSAQDHARTAPLHECHAGLTGTLKHVRGATTVHPRQAERIVEMATVVAGSAAARRARPPICGNVCTISPLSQDDVGIAAALIYAGAGIPVSFMPMPTMGSTAPASLAGAIVQGEAEHADTRAAMAAFKQKSGFWLRRHRPDHAWQKDFWDHVIRCDEDLGAQMRYIAENPVRKGLVRCWQDYPHAGAIGYDLGEVLVDAAVLNGR